MVVTSLGSTGHVQTHTPLGVATPVMGELERPFGEKASIHIIDQFWGTTIHSHWLN